MASQLNSTRSCSDYYQWHWGCAVVVTGYVKILSTVPASCFQSCLEVTSNPVMALKALTRLS